MWDHYLQVVQLPSRVSISTSKLFPLFFFCYISQSKTISSLFLVNFINDAILFDKSSKFSDGLASWGDFQLIIIESIDSLQLYQNSVNHLLQTFKAAVGLVVGLGNKLWYLDEAPINTQFLETWWSRRRCTWNWNSTFFRNTNLNIQYGIQFSIAKVLGFHHQDPSKRQGKVSRGQEGKCK